LNMYASLYEMKVGKYVRFYHTLNGQVFSS
jgi:hypothetical protein